MAFKSEMQRRAGLDSSSSSGIVTVGAGETLNIIGAALNPGTMRFVRGARFNLTGSLVTNGVIDLISSSFTMRPGFINNGIVLQSSVVRTKSITRSANNVTVTTGSYSGHDYQLQCRSLVRDAFENVSTPQSGATGTVPSFNDPNATGSGGYYRVAVDW